MTIQTQIHTENMSTLTLAFMGDSVYDRFVRERMIRRHPLMSAHDLHLKAVSAVRNDAQARTAVLLFDSLSQEERDVFMRGRNAKSQSVPKNADVMNYRMATAFEAVLGYLYLRGSMDRLEEILTICERSWGEY